MGKLFSGGDLMSNIRSHYSNVNGKTIESSRETLKLEPRHYLRESHSVREGDTRKNMKIKIHKKY
jgi:hypothetical protein